MIEAALFISILCMFAFFSIAFLRLRKKYFNTISVVAMLILEKDALTERLEKVELDQSENVSEGFIKFLSQSREAAFKYIEDVQVSIQNYVDVVDSGSQEEIGLARMELFSHLPEVLDSDGNIPG